jgi:hypothetical protein
MRVVTKLTGTRPLLLHNVQLADPDNAWARLRCERRVDKRLAAPSLDGRP